MTDSLAGLHSVAGPHLRLLAGAPADGRQLAWQLLLRGLVTRVVRGRCMRTRWGSFDELGAALQLPGDPADGWDALTDALCETDWLPGAGHVLVVIGAAATLVTQPEELADFVGFVETVARRRGGDVQVGASKPFHVVLQDEAAGLATLRVRLRSVRADYDELTGWAAEEPAAPAVPDRRCVFSPGSAKLDELDGRLLTALEGRAEVTEVRRTDEQVRADSPGPARVYAAVIDRFDDAAGVLDVMATAVAVRGALVSVTSDLPAARSTRAQAQLDNSTLLWPRPAAAEPESEPEVESRLEPEAETHPEADAETQPEPESGTKPGAEPDAETEAQAAPAAEGGSSAPDGVAPERGTLEVVAADLEWEFAPGSARPDRVDRTLAAVAARHDVPELWRSWCRPEPRRPWIRVVLAIADGHEVEVRRALVAALTGVATGEACVEVVSASGRTEAHAWLQTQSVPILEELPARGESRRPHAADLTAATKDPTSSDPPPESLPPPGTDPSGPAPAPGSEPPDLAAPAAENPHLENPGLEDGVAEDGELLPDPVDSTGPAATVVEWADHRRGEAVTALVAAWTAERARPEQRRLLLGVITAPGADVDQIRVEALAALGDGDTTQRPLLVAFTPSRRMPPAYLRLYRQGTTLWRGGDHRGGNARRSRVAPSFVELTLDDVVVDGVVFVGEPDFSRLSEPDPEPSDVEQAVIAWAREDADSIGLLTTIQRPEDGAADVLAPLLVLSVLVDSEPDPGRVRAALAPILLEHSVTRVVLGVFNPFQPDQDVSFYELFRASTMRWKTLRPVRREAAPEPGAGPP